MKLDMKMKMGIDMKIGMKTMIDRNGHGLTESTENILEA